MGERERGTVPAGAWLVVALIAGFNAVLVLGIACYQKGRADEQAAALAVGAGRYVADSETGQVRFVYFMKGSTP
jgi:hypothetical protein